MAGSLNKVLLIGNIAADPEARYTPSGSLVVNARLITNEYRRDRETGDRTEEATSHRLVFFDKNAETAQRYVTKGMSLYVEARIKNGSYTDKDGIKRYTTDLVVNSFQMLSPKNAQSASGEGRVGEDLVAVGVGDAAPDDFDDIPF